MGGMATKTVAEIKNIIENGELIHQVTVRCIERMGGTMKPVSMRMIHDIDESGNETKDYMVAATYETDKGRFAVKAFLSSEIIDDPDFPLINWLNDKAREQIGMI